MGNIRKNVKTGIALILLAFSTLVLAASINAKLAPYNTAPAIMGVTIHNDSSVRAAALSQARGLYKGIHGQSALPIGSTFQMIYQDSSWEQAMVIANIASITAMPIEGSQHPATDADPGNGIGGATGATGGSGAGTGPAPGPVTINPPSSGGGSGSGGFPCDVIIVNPYTCILVRAPDNSYKFEGGE